MAFLLFVIIVIGGIAAIALVTTAMARRGRAEAADWETSARAGREVTPTHPGTDRPGGPGTEAMNADQPGDAIPGPASTPSPAAADEAALPSEGTTRPDEPGTGHS